jgi:hypothetical protein
MTTAVSRVSLKETEGIRDLPGIVVRPMESAGYPIHGDGFREIPERPRWTLRLTIYADAAAPSYSAYASRMRSRMRSWAAVSAIARRSVKLRLSPLTEY